MLFLLHSLAHAATNAPLEAVKHFVQAGDLRDLPGLEQVLHPEFRVVARMPDGVSVLPRELYLTLVKGEKIGGVPRKGTYQLVMETQDLATIKGTLDSAAAHFDCTWTVVRGPSGWQVIQDAVVFAPVAP